MGLAAAPLQDGAEATDRVLRNWPPLWRLLPEADRVDKVAFPRSGGVGGCRLWPMRRSRSGLMTLSLMARLVVALGGRAAELVVFGHEEVAEISWPSWPGRYLASHPWASGAWELTEVSQEDWFSQRPGYAETGREIDQGSGACTSLAPACG